MTLPDITTKQQAILELIYRYRFVNRIQIQALMSHKNNRRIAEWLKDLRDKQYLEWIYDATDFAEKTKPAIYYLGLNGIRFLRTLDKYPLEELRKRYRESSRQPDYIARSLLLAGCGITLELNSAENTHYSFATNADFTNPNHDYLFLTDLQPHLHFVKETLVTKDSYLLEVFDASIPRYMLKKRLKDYIVYLGDGEWENKTNEDRPPIVLLACPTKTELIYAKRRTRKLLEDAQEDENEDIHIRFATIGQIKQHGVTGAIWEEA